MLNLLFKNRRKIKSFTIIELLIAMTVFVFVIISTLTIYTMTIQKHFQARKSQIVNEDLQYAIEVMNADIKNSFVVGEGPVDPPNKVIYLANKTKSPIYDDCLTTVNDTNCLVYKIAKDSNNNGRIWVKGKGDTAGYVELTSSRVTVDYDRSFFDVDAEALTSKHNPEVTILIVAREKTESLGGLSEIILQTTVSQRELDGEPVNRYRGTF